MDFERSSSSSLPETVNVGLSMVPQRAKMHPAAEPPRCQKLARQEVDIGREKKLSWISPLLEDPLLIIIAGVR